jgi:hypothetical protein
MSDKSLRLVTKAAEAALAKAVEVAGPDLSVIQFVQALVMLVMTKAKGDDQTRIRLTAALLTAVCLEVGADGAQAILNNVRKHTENVTAERE